MNINNIYNRTYCKLRYLFCTDILHSVISVVIDKTKKVVVST